MTKRIALFSVSDLRDLVEFAGVFVSKGWIVVATTEAFIKLRSSGIPVVHVNEFTGIQKEYPFPPTLHPKIEEALTSDTTHCRIEVVYDIPYSLEAGNDVGGRTLLALAAKGNRVPVCDYEDMKNVMEILKEKDYIPADVRDVLVAKTIYYVATNYLELLRRSGVTGYDGLIGSECMRLVNGENPYQVPASLFVSSTAGDDDLAIGNFEKLSGENPCYTNVADLDCIVNTLCKLAGAYKKAYNRLPYITVASKHGNACGLAVDWDDPCKTIEEALWGNPIAIWGGEVVTNYEIGEEQADLLFGSAERKEMYGSSSWMLDIVAAPDFSKESLRILGKRIRRKLLKNEALKDPSMPRCRWRYRQVRGGFLRQPPSDYIIDLDELDYARGKFGDGIIDALLISWVVAYTSNHGGNEVAISGKRKLIGVGGGPSTIGAAEIAVSRARANHHELHNSIFTADAFFPYTDAPQLLIEAGCRYGLVPGGGKREAEVRRLFSDHGVSMGFIPEKYRGFCKH